MINTDENTNFEFFRDCLSTPLIDKFAAKPLDSKAKRKSGHGNKKSHITTLDPEIDNGEPKDDVEELSDFIDYIAEEVFSSLPPSLRTLTYTAYTNSSTFQKLYAPPLTPSSTATLLKNLNPALIDTLTTYALLPPDPTSPTSNADPSSLLTPILNSYLSALTTTPLPPSQTKGLASGCEICDREHIPLTYHHLIPRAVHDKAVKRGWHTKEDLNSVAWLCRACHSFVHRVAGHEELARELFTVDRLLERDEVRRFAAWVGRVRWKSR